MFITTMIASGGQALLQLVNLFAIWKVVVVPQEAVL